MRVVFCGADISGYAAACWRALAQIKDVDALFLARYAGTGGATAFGPDLMREIPCRLLTPDEFENQELVHERVVSHAPDVIFISGWCFKSYRALLKIKALENCRFIMGMDTPLQYTLRQCAARFLLRSYIRRMDAVFVPGERSWQYARYLGVCEGRIVRGAYGFDVQAFNPCHDWRGKQAWPRRFLFVGRYTPVKGLDVLVKAYRKYRESVRDPWSLTCCGKGEMAALLQNEPGVTDRGFVPPAQQPELFAEHGVFILPSRYEPWGIVLGEACASGMPVICTQACGSAVELVRPYYNGLLCATDDVDALAEQMVWMHEHDRDLPRMGERAMAFAAPYAAELWAERFYDMALRLTNNRDRKQ